MPRFEFTDPYTKRVLPDDFTSPGWDSLLVIIASTVAGTGTTGGGEINPPPEEVFVAVNGLLDDGGFYLIDDAGFYLTFD